MFRRLFPFAVLLAAILLVAPIYCHAADVLPNVPEDALGFVVVNDLSRADAKAERLLRALQTSFPGSLSFLKAATGIGEGLDPHGELLLVALPGEKADDRPQLGMWLPASDYSKLISSMQGTATDGIAVVTIAGEDLLVAQQGSWAVVMDPAERPRLERILRSSGAVPERIAAWKNWIASNDVTAVVLPNGLRTLWNWVATDRPEDIAVISPPTGNAGDNPFGEPAAAEDDLFAIPNDSAAASEDWATVVRAEIRELQTQVPQLAGLLAAADAAACGVRVDANGNVSGGVRLALRGEMAAAIDVLPGDVLSEPPTLYQSGDFVVNGAGRVIPLLAVPAAGAYARLMIESLRDDIRVEVDDEVAARFQQAVERATSHIRAASVLNRPGEAQDGTYCNAFLAVRVDDSNAFVAGATEIMRLWNEMNKSDQDDAKLIFEVDTAKVGSRGGAQYSLDMAEAFGAAGIPEVRPSMERLFGPGGKLRLFVVPADDHTVLMAAGTAEQAAAALEVLRTAKSASWDEHTNRLLPRDAAWRIMVSPNGYTRWLKRQMDAVLGPVIGGPMIREFPTSPPVGLAAGIDRAEIWADVAVPAETVRGTGQYTHQR